MNLYHVNHLSVTVGINLLNFSRGYSFLFRSHSKTHATVTKSIYLYLELTLRQVSFSTQSVLTCIHNYYF